MNFYRQIKDGPVEVFYNRGRNTWFKSWEDDEPTIWYWIAFDGFTQHRYIESEVPAAILMTALLMD